MRRGRGGNGSGRKRGRRERGRLISFERAEDGAGEVFGLFEGVSASVDDEVENVGDDKADGGLDDEAGNSLGCYERADEISQASYDCGD